LNYFRKQCIEWCYNRSENGRYGDQLYMNDWPDKYEKVGIISNIGI